MTTKAIRDGSQTRKVLDFIRAEVAAGRDMPSPYRINKHMGWGSGASDVLVRLVQWGELRRVRHDGPVAQRYDLAMKSGVNGDGR